MPNLISSRRSLLKALAAALPLAITGTVGAQVQAARPSMRPLRLALVAPASGGPANLTEPFVRGLTPVLRRTDTELSIHLTGPRLKQISAATQAALSARPDALIALGDGLARLMQPALAAAPLPVIAAEVGARMPDSGAALPLTLTTSLHAWEAEWMHGSLLGQRGRPTHLLMSLLESGYDLPFAFTAGLSSARGLLTGTTIVNGAETYSPTALAQLVRDSGAAHMHLIASDLTNAPEILRACTRLGLQVTVGSLTAGAYSRALSWPDSASAVGISSARELGQPGWEQSAQATPSQTLTALGYDTGLWIAAAAQHLTQITPVSLVAALSGVQVAGVRGALNMDASGLLRAPLHLQDAGGRQTPLACAPTTHPLLTAHRTGLRSGWIEPYLFG